MTEYLTLTSYQTPILTFGYDEYLPCLTPVSNNNRNGQTSITVAAYLSSLQVHDCPELHCRALSTKHEHKLVHADCGVLPQALASHKQV